mmetsp:Transcript_73957/g.158497  ORF Transcript_73957/g.158497 Transcript_73957/m.158497 type:complete len:273 (-) Transcript_73957:48-866(-)
MPGALSKTPSHPMSFSLREYSLNRKRLPPPRSSSQPALHVLSEEDLAGGNGRWRQRKAEEEWRRKDIEMQEQQRLQKIKEKEMAVRKARKEETRRKALEEEKRQVLAERARKKKEQEDLEAETRRQEERLRMRREEEKREWFAKQPKTCETCKGMKKCVTCLGKGHVFSLFLVPQVGKESKEPMVDFGRLLQGCEDCGGYRQNTMGQLRMGSGLCAACNGVGKISPEIIPKANKPRFLTTASLGEGGGSVSPKSSPTLFPASPIAEGKAISD